MLQWTLECMYLFRLVFLAPLNKYPEVELLDHMAVLLLIFKGNSILSCIVTLPISNPTNSAQRFPFLHIFENTWCSFHDSHYDRCEGTSHYGCKMLFLDTVVLVVSFFSPSSLCVCCTSPLWFDKILQKLLLLVKFLLYVTSGFSLDGEEGDRGWDGWTTSPIQWTWTWANFGR